MIRYTLTIKRIIEETKDSVTLCFKQPGLRKINYKAGQYITLILRINGRKYARPYSLSSAPSVDSFLEITVKRIPDGIVSNYINNELKVGDVLEVMEPMGDFTFDSLNPARTIYLWGIGSGITPLYSLTKEILKTRPNTSIHLVYGNKLKESTIFSKQLLHLHQENANKLKLTHFYSQENIINDGKEVLKGRITPDFVSNLVSQNANYKESVHYICGPIGLKDTIKSTLFTLNIPASSVFTEDFELVIDPKELVEIQDCKVSLLFEGVTTNVYVPKGKSILDVALDNDIEIPYSCQTGNCNSCKVKLNEGELKMLGLSKERMDLAQNEFLLCCSYPLTNLISIEVI